MNNYTLILLKDGRNILVSNEVIKDSDYQYNLNGIIEKDTVPYGNSYKIIAGIDTLPTLTYSDEVRQELRDKYGWVDVEIEIKDFILHRRDFLIIGLDPIDKFSFGMKKGFELGKKAHQSITNKMFSLEEAKLIWNAGQEYWKTSGASITFEELIERKVELLQQPIQLNVEVEMIHCGYRDSVNNECVNCRTPKSEGVNCMNVIPARINNSILITKILN